MDLVRRPTGLSVSRSLDDLGGDDALFLDAPDLADVLPLVFGAIVRLSGFGVAQELQIPKSAHTLAVAR